MLSRGEHEEMNSLADRCAPLLAAFCGCISRGQNVFIAACTYFNNFLPMAWNSFGIGIGEKTKDCRKGLSPLNLGLLGSPCSREASVC